MPFLCPIKGHQRGSDDGCVISLILTKKCGHDSPPLEVMSTLGTCILSILPSVSTFFALPILVYDVSILRIEGSNKPHLLYRGSISNIGATLSLVLLLLYGCRSISNAGINLILR